MVLIVTDSFDTTANKVCSWLNADGAAFVRFNTENNDAVIKELSIGFNELDSIIITYHGIEYNLLDFDTIWFRRGHFSGAPFTLKHLNTNSETIKNEIKEHLNNEVKVLIEYVYKQIESKSINIPNNYNLNKLNVLQIARAIGLNIPKTIIAKNKSVILERFDNKEVISKNISEIILTDGKDENNQNFLMGQSTISSYASKLPEEFYYSLFQNNIIKKWEVRVFYLLGEMYASAIFSQSNNNANIDYRDHDPNIPNRLVPYEIPESLKDKISILMSQLNLKSGSLDLIYGTNNEYYFLEVNPVGQLDWVSHGNNFFLEKLIANKLLYGIKE